jgi:hypothetical protein
VVSPVSQSSAPLVSPLISRLLRRGIRSVAAEPAPTPA